MTLADGRHFPIWLSGYLAIWLSGYLAIWLLHWERRVLQMEGDP